ncbi:HD domain-containing protein [Candidatus Woesearchaeota archaeon]|nr:HD domain-containing protein [Candidatus Woesearchaeota archaeon]
MNPTLKTELIQLAKKYSHDDDPSHDFEHILRVLRNAEIIATKEGADLDIVIPAALFHDLVNYPKNHPKAKFSSELSAQKTGKLLRKLKNYPQYKIPSVEHAISCCSFSKKVVPNSLEGKVVQDADWLEATGAISIMRTFATTGIMKRPFYHLEDHFCEHREAEPLHYAVDLFYARLLRVHERLNTKTAKALAKRRTAFLQTFLEELKLELQMK